MKKYRLLLGTIIVTMGLTACSIRREPAETEAAVTPASNAAAIAPLAAETNAAEEAIERSAAATDTLPMLCVDGQLYRLSSRQPVTVDDNRTPSGHIKEAITIGDTPTGHEQSNFGSVDEPYFLNADNDELITSVEGLSLRFQLVDLTVQPVDLSSLDSDLSLLGADGVEIVYADSSIVVFHSFAGLFFCENRNDEWVITQTLDLEPLGANATQGDQYSLISSQKDAALISPQCYAPDNEIPVTYQYNFADRSLELNGYFEDQSDPDMVWSYSLDAVPIMEKLKNKAEVKDLWVSNLYPLSEFSSNVYGFIAVGADGISALQHGLYYSDLDQVVLVGVRE